jgi:glycosyltransferase involved in cell wall biosynthesis
MAQADLLYAPYGFDAESRRLTVRSFPYKVACYFAARKPVLVCAAPESSIARYARQWDCVELAEEPTVEAVGAALRRVAGSPERQRRMVEHGLQALAANHDIHRQRADLVRLLRHLTGGQSATT